MSALLEFSQVSVPQDEYDGGLSNVTFMLDPGDVMVILTETKLMNTPLCNTAQGLLTPDSGVVRYDGSDWQAMAPDEQAMHRAGTGRIYGMQGAWLSNLDVDESVTLRVRHRAHRADAEVYEEARRLAAQLGLNELPGKRPPLLSKETLQICQCVRALLDAPNLILAEYATYHMSRSVKEHFMNLLQERRKSGMAVLWLTVDLQECSLFGTSARRFRYAEGTLQEFGSEA